MPQIDLHAQRILRLECRKTAGQAPPNFIVTGQNSLSPDTLEEGGTLRRLWTAHQAAAGSVPKYQRLLSTFGFSPSTTEPLHLFVFLKDLRVSLKGLSARATAMVCRLHSSFAYPQDKIPRGTFVPRHGSGAATSQTSPCLWLVGAGTRALAGWINQGAAIKAARRSAGRAQRASGSGLKAWVDHSAVQISSQAGNITNGAFIGTRANTGAIANKTNQEGQVAIRVCNSANGRIFTAGGWSIWINISCR
jgi:hypothetical protein